MVQRLQPAEVFEKIRLRGLLSTLQEALVSNQAHLPAEDGVALNVKPVVTTRAARKRKCLAADRLVSIPPVCRRRLVRRTQKQSEPVLQSTDVEEVTLLAEESTERAVR